MKNKITVLCLLSVVLCLMLLPSCTTDPNAANDFPDITAREEGKAPIPPTVPDPLESCIHEFTSYEAVDGGHIRCCSFCNEPAGEVEEHVLGEYTVSPVNSVVFKKIRVFAHVAECSICDQPAEYILSTRQYLD